MASQRRIEANQRNSRRSSGPRSARGKARSAKNGTTHGLAGREIVLSGPERARLRRRLAAWTGEFQPVDDRERALVERAAMAEVVLGRIEAIDRNAWAEARAGAVERFDQEHRERIEALAARLGERPGFVRPELESSPVGIGWMIEGWADLESILERDGRWGPGEIDRALSLLGRSRAPLDRDRRTLRLLDLEGCEAWDESAIRAVRQTVTIEMARLRRLRERREPIHQLDRIEAPDRAMPDERTLRAIIRYESKWSNALRRAIRDLERLRRERRRAERAESRRRAREEQDATAVPSPLRVVPEADQIRAPRIAPGTCPVGEVERPALEAGVRDQMIPIRSGLGRETGHFSQSEPNEDRPQILKFQKLTGGIRSAARIAASAWLAATLGLVAAGLGAVDPGRSEGASWGWFLQTEANAGGAPGPGRGIGAFLPISENRRRRVGEGAWAGSGDGSAPGCANDASLMICWQRPPDAGP